MNNYVSIESRLLVKINSGLMCQLTPLSTYLRYLFTVAIKGVEHHHRFEEYVTGLPPAAAKTTHPSHGDVLFLAEWGGGRI